MIEVGKVVTQPARAINNFGSHKEEAVSVMMTETEIRLRIITQEGTYFAILSPQRAIEVAQILMKAAECQTEYAKAAKDLEAQKDKLNAKYKDMISGLGLENPDLKAQDLTLAKRAPMWGTK